MTNKNMVKLEGFSRFVEVEDTVYEFAGGSYDSDGNGLLSATYAPIAKLNVDCLDATEDEN